MVLRRLAPVLIGLVGLVFAVIGGVFLASQTWSPATGTVGACTTRVDRTGTGTNSTRTRHLCEVTWQADGRVRTATIEVGGSDAVLGRAVDLRVNGDSVVQASPLWVGIACAGGGLGLIVVAGLLFVRSRRATA